MIRSFTALSHYYSDSGSERPPRMERRNSQPYRKTAWYLFRSKEDRKRYQNVSRQSYCPFFFVISRPATWPPVRETKAVAVLGILPNARATTETPSCFVCRVE